MAEEHDQRIFRHWNNEFAKEQLRSLERMGIREFDYHANRVLSQSWNMFGAIDAVFNTANGVLSCFLGDADRSRDEIIRLFNEYSFNSKLIRTLIEIKDLKFERELNRTDDRWLKPAFKILASRVLFYCAARTLYYAINSGEKVERLYEVLSTKEATEGSEKFERLQAAEITSSGPIESALPGAAEDYPNQTRIYEGYDHIVSTEGTLGGKPRIDGTRITVEVIASNFLMGSSIAEIIGYYPDLSAEKIEEALLFWMRRAGASR